MLESHTDAELESLYDTAWDNDDTEMCLAIIVEQRRRAERFACYRGWYTGPTRAPAQA